MSARLLLPSLCLALLAAASCQSSAPYGSPTRTAAAVGFGAVGAAANRLAGGCFAACRIGTHCNKATGLCETGAEILPASRAPVVETADGHRAPMTVRSTSYAPGHEYVVPPASAADAGCEPTSSELGDGSGVACEMDGGTL